MSTSVLVDESLAFARREDADLNLVSGDTRLKETCPKTGESIAEEPRAVPTEQRKKFDGTDFPSWLGFDPLKKPDEPYTFPFPSMDGDPWEKVTKMVKRHDDHMCDAWVEEIQNILVFAGLFSAVVTAFAVETQKSLQPDPAMASVVLLAQIASHLTANDNITASPSFIHHSGDASFQIIRTNAFIFLSLILALGTALIGILALQWIRSYKNQELRSHQDRLSIRQGRYQALKDWKVPQIITALPIMLQIALVLFFIGLVDMLKSLDTVIATIVGVVVAVILALVLFTTITPGLYVCFLHKAYSRKKPASIPPYCSPQSWLFYKLIAYVNGAWSLLRGSWLRQTIVSSWDDFLLRSVPNYSEGSFDHWLSPALGWVFQNLTTEESFCSAYHCFQSLAKRDVAEKIVTDHLWTDKRPPHKLFPDFKTLESSSYSAVLSLYVLQYRFQHRTAPRNLYLHSMELGLRAMACNTPRYDSSGNRSTIYFPTTLLLKLEPEIVPGMGKQSTLQEQNIWLYSFLLTLHLSCAHFPQGDNSMSRQFSVFWGIIIDRFGTRVGEESLCCLQDWIKGVPQNSCETDRARLVACIVNVITYLPLRSKALASAAEFTQSEAFAKTLDCFVDDPGVRGTWIQTISNWNGSPSVLYHWDHFLISLTLDKKYWVLGSSQENLHTLKEELASTGRLSIDFPRAPHNFTPTPRSSLLTSSRLFTTVFGSPRSSVATLPLPTSMKRSSLSAQQLTDFESNAVVGSDITPPEPIVDTPTSQNYVSSYSSTPVYTPDQLLHPNPFVQEEIVTDDRPGIASGSMTIIIDSNPADLVPDSPRLPPVVADTPQLRSPFATLHERIAPSYVGNNSTGDISTPSSPGPTQHFLDPITWAMEMTEFEPDVEPWAPNGRDRSPELLLPAQSGMSVTSYTGYSER